MMNKKWLIKDRIDDDFFRKVCAEAKSMAEAASILNLHFNSFKKRAIELGCYDTNQAGKGIAKSRARIPIEEIIFQGLHPQYQSYKLKKRLLSEGYKIQECEICGIQEWNQMIISFELHHVDGIRTNHLLENLQLLCPNCHSQTNTFRARNRKI